MKSIVTLIVIFIVLSSTFLFYYFNTIEKESKYQYFKQQDFNYLKNKNEIFEEKIAIIFFKTECDICSFEIKNLQYDIYSDIDFILCSYQHSDTIINYINSSGVNLESNVFVSQLDTFLMENKYSILRFPSYILYENDYLLSSGSGLLTDQKIQRAFYKNY